MTKKKLEPVEPKKVLQLDFMRAKDYLHKAGIMTAEDVYKAVDYIFDSWDLRNGSQFSVNWTQWEIDAGKWDKDKPVYKKFCEEMAKIYGDIEMTCSVWW